jgi:hypothetical protein
MNLAKKLNFSVLINEFVGVNRTCTSRDVNTNNLRQRAYCLALNLNYLHKMAEQEEDMKRKRRLSTAREKHGIVNYCLQRRELTPLTINITKLFLLTF